MSQEAATPVAHLKQSVERSVASITQRVQHKGVSDQFVAVLQLLCYQLMLGQIIRLFGATRDACQAHNAGQALQLAIDTENGKNAGTDGVSHPDLFGQIVAMVRNRHCYKLSMSRFNETLNTLSSLVEKNPLYGIALSYYLYSVYPLLKELLYETSVITLGLDVAGHAYWKENTPESIELIRAKLLRAFGQELSEHLVHYAKLEIALDKMIHLVEDALVQVFIHQPPAHAHIAAPHVVSQPMAVPAAV